MLRTTYMNVYGVYGQHDKTDQSIKFLDFLAVVLAKTFPFMYHLPLED